MCLSLFRDPPLPLGCWSSPSPLRCPSHAWWLLTTSSPRSNRPCSPLSSSLPLRRRRPLLSACSKVGSLPQRISWPSRSTLPSAGFRLISGPRQAWSWKLRGVKRKTVRTTRNLCNMLLMSTCYICCTPKDVDLLNAVAPANDRRKPIAAGLTGGLTRSL